MTPRDIEWTDCFILSWILISFSYHSFYLIPSSVTKGRYCNWLKIKPEVESYLRMRSFYMDVQTEVKLVSGRLDGSLEPLIEQKLII